MSSPPSPLYHRVPKNVIDDIRAKGVEPRSPADKIAPWKFSSWAQKPENATTIEGLRGILLKLEDTSWIDETQWKKLTSGEVRLQVTVPYDRLKEVA